MCLFPCKDRLVNVVFTFFYMVFTFNTHFKKSPKSICLNRNGSKFIYSLAHNVVKMEDYSTPGLPVHHQLPESTQTHVH